MSAKLSGNHSVTLDGQSAVRATSVAFSLSRWQTEAVQANSAMSSYVYILASKKNGTLYTGVTADLARRVFEHKQGSTGSFTGRYGVTRLVWYREYQDIGEAIVEEKRIKKWRRAWKIRLIEEMNPDWHELYGGMGW